MPVTLPSGIQSGDLLLAVAANDGGDESLAIAGFTQIGVSGSGDGRVFFRIADGTEGSTTTATVATAERIVVRCFRVTDWHGATPPELAAESNSSSPPTLAPSWGAADTLWFAFVTNGSGSSVSSYPANYVASQHSDNTGVTSADAFVGTAARALSASSETPGSWVLGDSQPAFADSFTVAVRPAATNDQSASVAPLTAAWTVPLVTAAFVLLSAASVAPATAAWSTPAVDRTIRSCPIGECRSRDSRLDAHTSDGVIDKPADRRRVACFRSLVGDTRVSRL